MKKKTVIICLVGLCILATILGVLYFVNKKSDVYEEDGMKYISKTVGKDFYVYSDGKWGKKFLKGVDIGAAKPGTFPGELAITKEEYLRWFKYISDMNADVIRVYTTLKPEFYDALLEFNQKAEKPLYLIQGVWVNEDTMAQLMDAYADNGKILNDFIKDATDLVDIVHGNANLPVKNGFASGIYKSDVSKYVIGWILGTEWDPYFVKATNDNNPDKTSYSGSYLYTENASPFEAFLCEAGDKTLTYEATKYTMTRALAFNNWLTTDMLSHPNEPYENEDLVPVNTEHIKAQSTYKSGLFASYHIYPYYPEFMNYQKEYTVKDENGNVDTYKAYLSDLIKQHTVPVMVAEFGVPASRGKAHDSIYSGYNQGNISETKQGEIITSLLDDIYSQGYCGAIVFAWQDEWFKKTWNTMDLDLSDRRPFWSNPQTNEQEFGLLAFDPGAEKSVCYVDGDISDWSKDEPLSTTDNASIYVKSDEKYVYIMVKTTDFDFSKDSLFIPIDTLQGQGSTTDTAKNISFERAADFLVQINGENNSKVLVDAYYDSFYYTYGEAHNMIPKVTKYTQNGSGIFNPIYLCLSRAIYLPQDKRTIPFSKYETGVLKYGDANPDDEGYDSLADFCYKDGNIEIKIPWQLLNVMDPSTKSVIGDLYKNKGIVAETLDGMYFGAKIVKSGTTDSTQIGMKYYTWSTWEVPTYHERLKPSYFTVQKAFAKYK